MGDLLELSALVNLLAGDAPDGTMPAPAGRIAREVVHTWDTTAGIYRTRPLHGGPEASVDPTDAVRGVTVGQVVHVLHRGAASRTAIGVDQSVGIAARYGTNVAADIGAATSVNGQTPTAAGAVSLSAGDVGAASASHSHTYTQVGAASASHSHTYTQVGAASANHGHQLAYLNYSIPGISGSSTLVQLIDYVNGPISDILTAIRTCLQSMTQGPS